MPETDTRILREESDLNQLYDTLEAELQHGPLDVVWKPYKPKRTTLANRYYWLILSQAGDQTGYTKDELHNFMRWKFLGAQKKEIFNCPFNMLPSTTDLNTKEFAEYVRSVEHFIIESGFTIKAPPYYEDIWK